MDNNGTCSIQRFKLTLKELIQELGEILTELSKYNLTPFTAKSITMTISLIEHYDVEEFMKAIAQKYKYWYKINERDISFISDELYSIIASSGIIFEVKLLSVPFLAYQQIKESINWRGVPENELPINKTDIDNIWKYIESLITITCNYIYNVRNSKDGKNTNFCGEIDLRIYEQMFKFKLLLD